MPISEYFKGHGEEVMKSIRKAHPGYSAKEVNREFYSTANARRAKPRSSKRSSGRRNKR